MSVVCYTVQVAHSKLISHMNVSLFVYLWPMVVLYDFALSFS